MQIDTKHEIKRANIEMIGKIMLSKKYVDITLKSQSGQVSYVEIINKEKIKDDD